MNTNPKRIFSIVGCCFALSACGGGGDSDNSPIIGQCSSAGERIQFLEYMEENYFWNDSMPANVDPNNYSDVYALLEALMVAEDRYSFILTEEEYQSRFVTAEYAGFGFSSRITPDNRVFINYVYAASPAAQAGIKRSDEITHINGESVTTLLQQNQYEAALGAAEVGVSVELTWQDTQGASFTDTLTKQSVETNTVLAVDRFDIAGKDVGYFVLNTFINRTGSDLNSAYNQLTGVDELIIDVRYNGGGLTRFANQASTQATGDNVIGEIFTTYLYNDNNSDLNFTEQFQLYEGVQQLDLERVYILTTGSSCSSSELIINALDPFVEVVVIGQPTCGKPVGQVPEPLCDKRTFVVNFETVNANNQGRYFDGLAPNCSATDALVGDWGDPADPMLQAAAYHLSYGQCAPAANNGEVTTSALQRQPVKMPMTLPELWRNEH